jgi:hypothetical protein
MPTNPWATGIQTAADAVARAIEESPALYGTPSATRAVAAGVPTAPTTAPPGGVVFVFPQRIPQLFRALAKGFGWRKN